MPSERIVVVYAAPIPVGNRVTVRWYRLEKSGLFGKKSKTREYEPAIIDHDSGIEWVTDFAHDGGGGIKSPNEPIAIADVPREGFVVDRELTGKVARCRVVHVRSFSELDVQTELVIES